MKKKCLLFSLLALLILLNTYSQQTSKTEEFKTKYNNYFELEPEVIFTQLNKTIFFNGEELWFKTYIYNNRTQTPYISTTNVFTSVYNEKGVLLKKRIYHAENGSTHGNIKIDSTFTPGIYFIKTTTSWMKNFNEDNSYIQKFEILDSNKTISKENSHTQNYDFQILPESGHIINNTVNKVGFKIIDLNGKGVKITSGKIFDGDNNVITTFKSNQFGIGKFTLKASIEKKYIAEAILANGEIITAALPPIDKEGIGLSIENFRSDEILISLRTNNATISKLLKKNYFIIIHRDGLIKKMDIHFEKNKVDYLINLEKTALYPGINIITLFNENNQPIAERMIFNEKITPIKSIEVSEIIKKQDSTVITLKTDSQSGLNKNLSVSVLPNSNESYTNNSTIISTFLLKPYIKGTIENPRYYFDNMNRKKMYDLDLLLLTQGWSRYDWDNIFNNPSKITYNFESGFQIKGKLNKHEYKNGDEILLVSKENFIHLYTTLEKGNFFSFEKLYLKENSTLNFRLKNKKGKFSKPIPYYNVFPNYTFDKLNVLNFKTTSNKIIFNNDSGFEAFDVKPENILETITLKTVTNKKIGLENKPYGYSTGKHITFENEKSLRTPITDYIRRNGFEVINTGLAVRITSRRGATNWGGAFSPKVFIDNVEIDVSNPVNLGISTNSPGDGNTNQLAALTVEDVEEIFITHQGNLYAAPGGVIHIFTKTQFSSKRENSFIGSTAKFGYSEADAYYNPYYLNTSSSTFTKLGSINWIPNLVTNELGELTFKIPNYTHDDINLYIEGMSDDGSLFSKIETINLEK